MLITSSRITVGTEAPENTYSRPSRCSVRPLEAIGTMPVIVVGTGGQWFTLVHLQYNLCHGNAILLFYFCWIPFCHFLFYSKFIEGYKKNFNK